MLIIVSIPVEWDVELCETELTEETEETDETEDLEEETLTSTPLTFSTSSSAKDSVSVVISFESMPLEAVTSLTSLLSSFSKASAEASAEASVEASAKVSGAGVSVQASKRLASVPKSFSSLSVLII